MLRCGENASSIFGVTQIAGFLFFGESRARRKKGPSGSIKEKINPHLGDAEYTTTLHWTKQLRIGLNDNNY